VEHQRKRWMRPDAERYWRHDRERYFKLGVLDGKSAFDRSRADARDAAHERAFQDELLALRRDHAVLRRAFEEVKAALLARKAGFDPNQPRVPAGNSYGGQWTDAGGGGSSDEGIVLSDETPDDEWIPGAQYAQNDRSTDRLVDLHEERELGGHAIERHVGKSPESLLTHVRREVARVDETGLTRDLRAGSFPSVEAANKLVNTTLAQNQDKLERVRSGLSPREQLDAQFGSITGYEAYARTEHSQPYMRATYGVRVVIVRDRRSAKGYRVDTAFPMNFGR
jgi:hypothetical protein